MGRECNGMSSMAIPVANRRGAELGLGIGVVSSIALLLVPLPPVILDLLIAGSIGSALVVLLASLNTTDPLEFSSFPQVLLLVTLFGLALNVRSTRLILFQAPPGALK